jgi:hypothetical protein
MLRYKILTHTKTMLYFSNGYSGTLLEKMQIIIEEIKC